MTRLLTAILEVLSVRACRAHARAARKRGNDPNTFAEAATACGTIVGRWNYAII